SSLLFTAGMTPRWGKVAEGSTTTDWDEEEIARKISIQTGLAYAEWSPTPTGPSGSSEKVKINFIDLPGYSTFITETKASLISADAALIAVDGHVGAQVTTEKVWDYCTEYDTPRAFVLTWMDRELSSFERSMESLQEVFGRNVVSLQLPIGSEKGFRGIIDLVAMKAHIYKPDGDGKPSIEEIPAALADEAKEAHEKLLEMIAEGDDEMMEDFFREGTIPINDFKVKSGVLKNDATLINYNRNLPERFQHIQIVQGKQLTEVSELHAGDIGAIAKLKETTTGETLGDKTSPIYYSPAQLPEPS